MFRRVPGFAADVWHAPADRLTIVVLANDERVEATEVADELMREALGT